MNRKDYESETMIAVSHTLRASFGAGEDGTGRRTPLIPIAYSAMPMNSSKDFVVRETEVAQPVIAAGPGMGNQGGDYIAQSWAVRRLTPTECERLQGFPDHYTNVPWRGKTGTPDGPRYKALGNSMACNCMRWIGRRIDLVNSHPSLRNL